MGKHQVPTRKLSLLRSLLHGQWGLWHPSKVTPAWPVATVAPPLRSLLHGQWGLWHPHSGHSCMPSGDCGTHTPAPPPSSIGVSAPTPVSFLGHTYMPSRSAFRTPVTFSSVLCFTLSHGGWLFPGDAGHGVGCHAVAEGLLRQECHPA